MTEGEAQTQLRRLLPGGTLYNQGDKKVAAWGLQQSIRLTDMSWVGVLVRVANILNVSPTARQAAKRFDVKPPSGGVC